jgi:hypothetical protein
MSYGWWHMLLIPATEEAEGGESWVCCHSKIVSKAKTKSRASGIVQVVECLPSMRLWVQSSSATDKQKIMGTANL